MTGIERDGPRAVYSQIGERLAAEIRAHYRAGQRLPAEHELAARFAVNRHTVRHAIDGLVAAGLIERRRGLGTFVLDQPIAYPVHAQARFTENVEALGRAHDSRVIHTATIPAEPGVAERLGLRTGHTVFWLETMRMVENTPFTVISHFLPAERFPDLLAAYDGGSLHATLQRRYGVTLRRALTLVSALLPQGDDASHLLVPRGTPVLRLKTVNVDPAGVPVEYAIARARADRIELHLDHGGSP